MAEKIFIGGTGRSGTTVLYDLLKSHNDIYAFDQEMRFIVDYNGLINLVDALTSNFSIPQAREALYHFVQLMKYHLTDKYSTPYVGYDFTDYFGFEFYNEQVNKFISYLTDGQFYGSSYQVSDTGLLESLKYLMRATIFRNRPRLLPKRTMYNAKYFRSRDVLCRSVENLVSSLFIEATRNHNKSIWCEKTPSNIFHIDFIYEVFPDCHFVHIKRDPRGVIQSMQNQFWADSNLRDACFSLKHAYNKWMNLKTSVNFDKHNYLEIKLEDLASENNTCIEELTNFLEVENEFHNPPILSLDKVNYWKNSMSSEDLNIINGILADEIEAMGYKV